MTAPRLVTALVVCLALGCSGAKPRVPVYGQVKLRGYPVRGGLIAFTPDRERGFRGETQRVDLGADGRSRAAPRAARRSPGAGGGVPPGWYRIAVGSLDTPIASRFQDPDLAGLEREV